jgi:hypothetical protein
MWSPIKQLNKCMLTMSQPGAKAVQLRPKTADAMQSLQSSKLVYIQMDICLDMDGVLLVDRRAAVQVSKFSGTVCVRGLYHQL